MVGRRKIGIQNAKGQAVWLGPVYDLCGQESQFHVYLPCLDAHVLTKVRWKLYSGLSS